MLYALDLPHVYDLSLSDSQYQLVVRKYWKEYPNFFIQHEFFLLLNKDTHPHFVHQIEFHSRNFLQKMTRLHHRNLAPKAKEFANVVYFIVWLRFTG